MPRKLAAESDKRPVQNKDTGVMAKGRINEESRVLYTCTDRTALRKPGTDSNRNTEVDTKSQTQNLARPTLVALRRKHGAAELLMCRWGRAAGLTLPRLEIEALEHGCATPVSTFHDVHCRHTLTLRSRRRSGTSGMGTKQ